MRMLFSPVITSDETHYWLRSTTMSSPGWRKCGYLRCTTWYICHGWFDSKFKFPHLFNSTPHVYLSCMGAITQVWAPHLSLGYALWGKAEWLVHQLGNFTNLPYTLSMRYQQLQCYQLCDGEGITENRIEVGPGSMIVRESIPSLGSQTPRHVYRYVLTLPNKMHGIWCMWSVIVYMHVHVSQMKFNSFS